MPGDFNEAIFMKGNFMEKESGEKGALLAFLQEVEALHFQPTTLKSGRVSPYFFNSGRFRTGGQLARLGEYYAQTIARVAPKATIVFGPAYKGIPLCVAAAMALSRLTGREIGYLFDRKEVKEHGDGGMFVGRVPEAGESLVMVDDVITDGGTKLDAVARLRAAFPAPIDALVIAFNRQETDAEGHDAVARFESATGVPLASLLSVADLEALLESQHGEGTSASIIPDAPTVLEAIREYRRRYGVVPDGTPGSVG